MKKFIVNATKNVGQGGVTNKVMEFFNHKGDAILETSELTISQVKQIIAENAGNHCTNNYTKKIVRGAC